jgi:hypothetical protein
LARRHGPGCRRLGRLPANPPTDTFNDRLVVIVEVISESTRRTDEHEKRQASLAIDSLRV